MSREHCADDCTIYPFRDLKNTEFKSECKHKHKIKCERCESLEHVLKEIHINICNIDINEEQRNRIRFDFNQYQAATNEWKAHLLRTVLQEEAKQDELGKLDDETCQPRTQG